MKVWERETERNKYKRWTIWDWKLKETTNERQEYHESKERETEKDLTISKSRL